MRLTTKLALIAAVLYAAIPSNALGATVSIASDDVSLHYLAAPGEGNQVTLSESALTVTIIDSGAVISAGNGCFQIDEHEVTCAEATLVFVNLGDLDDTASAITGDVDFSFFGEGGDDVLTLCSNCSTGDLYGGPGADTLQGGRYSSLTGGGGPDTLIGGVRSDFVSDGGGNDTIDTGGGADVIYPGSGDDVIDAGPGVNDELDYEYGGNRPGKGVIVDLRLGRAISKGMKTMTGIEHVTGTDFADELYGDGERNILNGWDGDDLLLGRGGDDVLNYLGFESEGDDRLRGGPGDDRLRADGGADLLVGGRGDDVLHGGRGEDRMFGRGGKDDLRARDGFRDLLFGGRGADVGRLDRGLDETRSIERF